MKIQVNGVLRSVAEAATLFDLFQELKIDPKEVVVEHNGSYLPADRDPAGLRLEQGDVLEIVHFVGGG